MKLPTMSASKTAVFLGAYYLSIGVALAQEGGLGAAVQTTSQSIYDIIDTAAPVIMLILFAVGGITIAITRRVGSIVWVFVGGFVVGAAALFVNLAGLATTTTI